jgi:hypothetical protein
LEGESKRKGQKELVSPKKEKEKEKGTKGSRKEGKKRY